MIYHSKFKSREHPLPETTKVADSKLTPLLQPRELLSVGTLLAASAVAVMAIVCRWYIEYQGQGLLLLLISASVMCGLVLLHRIDKGGLVERVCHYNLATISVIALLVWSPNFAFSILVCAPVLIAATLPLWFRVFGYEYRGLADSGGPATSGRRDIDAMVDPGTGVHLPPESRSINSGIASEQLEPPAADAESDLESEHDPWTFVRVQFAEDSTLAQNVAQWHQPDGARCIVANIRCHFSTLDETCIVQLPFWPILDQTPEVFCRVADGPAASIKATQELPHGLRLEVRLDDRSPAAASNLKHDVIVEVVASVSSGTNEVAA